VTSTPPHRAGANGYCQVCGPSGGMFPCAAWLAAGPIGTTSRSSCCTLFGLAWQAYERTSNAASDREWGQIDAYGAIILAAAAAEAFINELASLARQAVDEDPRGWPPHPPQIAAFASQVLAAETGRSTGRRASTPGKFVVALKALTGLRPDAGRRVHQDFALLMRARDGLIHTKLDVQPAQPGSLPHAPSSSLPPVVAQLGPRNVTAMESGLSAIDSLSTRGVARWACASAAAIVQEVIASMPRGSGGQRSLDFEVNHFARWFRLPPLSESSEGTAAP
jgi:hypothetical protein